MAAKRRSGRDLVMACRMAGWLTGAIVGQSSNHGNIEWFEKKGDVALGCLLWATEVSGRRITDVFNWAHLWGQEEALQVLADNPDSTPPVLEVVRRMLAENRTAGLVWDTIELSLTWTVIPQLAATVTPALGDGFDVGRFLDQPDALYVVASGDEDSADTAVQGVCQLRALRGRVQGCNARHGGLDSPLWIGLDEITTVCPIDLPTLLSDSAKKGVFQSILLRPRICAAG